MADLCRRLGCEFPECRVEQAHVLHTWLVDIHATADQTKRILNCLDDVHLLSLPRCERILCLPEVLTATHFRILFYNNIAFILGWRKRRDFADEIFHLARELWPDEDELPTLGQGICSPSSARQATPAVPSMQAEDQAKGERSKENNAGIGQELGGGFRVKCRRNVTSGGVVHQPAECFISATPATHKSSEATLVRRRPAPASGGSRRNSSSPDSLRSTGCSKLQHRRKKEFCRKRAEDKYSGEGKAEG